MQPLDYNSDYFNGVNPAGYTRYVKKDVRWNIGATNFKALNALAGKKVLELGCAHGFMVEELRSLGVDAYGIDVSQYAYDSASPELRSYLKLADIRTGLVNYKNKEFDLVFGMAILSCLTDEEAIVVANECLRISKKVVFLVLEKGPAEYYNMKTVNEWASLFPSQVMVKDFYSIF